MPDSGEQSGAQGVGYPERIGRFELLIPIASGGMATVYLARTQGFAGFERELALKLVHPHLQNESEFTHGLLQEAKLAARIRHPNVVSVLDVGREDAGVYLVMDYVEGSSLSQLLARASAAGEPIPVGVALKIVTDALAGLHAAHELSDKRGRPMGLVHRDFSPQNVLVGIDGVARLTDFGVAKAASRLSRTATGTIKGKLAYMAPEQARAERVDRRSDIWSAGVVLWEIFARRRLFTGSEAQMILSIVGGEVPRLSRVVPDIPPSIETAIASALSLDPRRRPATARELRAELLGGAAGVYQLADAGDVAAYVERLIGPVISRRREQIQEMLQLRSGRTAASVAAEPIATEDSAPSALETAPIKASRRWHPVAIAAAGVGVGALASLFVVRAAEPDRDAPVVTAPATAAAVAPSAVLEPLATPAPEPPAEPAPEREIVITANLAIARIVVDGREQTVDPPKRRISLPIPARARTLTAISSEGRRAAQELSADRRSINVQFSSITRARAGGGDPLSGYNPYADAGR